MRINRRALLVGAGATLAAGRSVIAAEPGFIPLWPDTPPGGGGPSGPMKDNGRGAISSIALPGLEAFLPEQPNGAAVLIAAGGGYRRIMMDLEARPAGRWLAARGITAFSLLYRLPREDWASGRLAPLQDAQRALRLIRARASRYGLDPEHVGVLGFSAGGYLMGLAATRFDLRTYDPVDAMDALSAKPSSAALAYPVITLEQPYDDSSTAHQVVGRHGDPALAYEWSVQTGVRAGGPPVFLVHAADDQVAAAANTRIMTQACMRAGVPVEEHLPQTGRHGFGMGRPGTESEAWPGWYEAWLRRAGMLS
ncbi:alpha/beta hydrolase [Methylobacterium sp. C25]|uniref:alpha/beta hydrolase n=1 Tax=Methylobacterium sp. C25 TaxID=2721622 RepID=UPI001F189E05|nr:alpha/beta hydrolase [Methylobacterium sp. C25]MCE4223507.1 alpha/beta hydrolase [Methylobacterium sp. C25]